MVESEIKINEPEINKDGSENMPDSYQETIELPNKPQKKSLFGSLKNLLVLRSWNYIKFAKKAIRATNLIKQVTLCICFFVAGANAQNKWMFLFVFFGASQMLSINRFEIVFWVNLILSCVIAGSQVNTSLSWFIMFFFIAITQMLIVFSEPNSIFKNKVNKFYTQRTSI